MSIQRGVVIFPKIPIPFLSSCGIQSSAFVKNSGSPTARPSIVGLNTAERTLRYSFFPVRQYIPAVKTRMFMDMTYTEE